MTLLNLSKKPWVGHTVKSCDPWIEKLNILIKMRTPVTRSNIFNFICSIRAQTLARLTWSKNPGVGHKIGRKMKLITKYFDRITLHANHSVEHFQFDNNGLFFKLIFSHVIWKLFGNKASAFLYLFWVHIYKYCEWKMDFIWRRKFIGNHLKQ